mmetsp:Transcript_19966/g.37647  ORF Transcript_19966/g.37647 Transcript_19966/m.37647 type:complete len:746 (+) Transcript_19966:59-2296(+)
MERHASVLIAATTGLNLKDSGDKKGAACTMLAVADMDACKAKDLDKALASAEQALETFQDVGDKKMEASTQLVLASIYFQKTRTEDAHGASKSAMDIFKGMGDKSGEAKACHSMALSYSIAEDYEDAVKSAKKALAIYLGMGDKKSAAFELKTMASWYMKCDKPFKAFPKAKEALALIRDAGDDPRAEAVALQMACEALCKDNAPKKALKLAQEGLDKFRAAGDKLAIASGLEALLHTYVLTDSPGEALEAAEEAMDLVKSLKDKRLEMDLLHSVCKAKLKNDDKAEAVEAMKQAAAIAKDLDDPCEEADAMKTMASILKDDPDAMNDALEACADAKALYRAAGCTAKEAEMCLYTADLHSMRGSDQIMSEASEAQELYAEIEDASGEAMALGVIAKFQLAKMDYADALDAAESAVELYKQTGQKKGQASAMKDMAQALMNLDSDSKGEDEEEEEEDSGTTAESTLLEALALSKEVGAKSLEAAINCMLCQVYIKSMAKEDITGMLPQSFQATQAKARKASQEALTLAGKGGDKAVRASALFWRSEVLIWCFRGGEALGAAIEAEKVFAATGDVRGQAHSKVLMADLTLMVGKKDEASKLADAALELATSNPSAADAEAAARNVIAKIEEASKAPVIAQVAAVADVGPAVAAAAASVTEVAVSKKIDKTAATKKIMDLAAQVIAGDEGDLHADVPFMEAGIDSLGSVQLVTDVGREFGLNLGPSVVFDYPTVAQLVDHVIEESGA